MNPKKNDVREHFTRHEERAEKTNSVQPRVRLFFTFFYSCGFTFFSNLGQGLNVEVHKEEEY